MLHYFGIGILLLPLGSLSGCSDPVERNIAKLIEGGEAAEEAKMELNLAKGSALAPLIAAFQRRDHPPRARRDLAEALYRLYLREEDKRILEVLIGGLEDPDAGVRTVVARKLGDLRKRESAGPLIAFLEREKDDVVRQEILVALELMGMARARWGLGFGGSAIKTDKMTPEERAHFTDILVHMTQEELSDSLRLKTQEWLEILAEEKAVDAHSLLLKGDLHGAEERLLVAKELIPDSKNINQKLGRFYYDNGDVEKGLKILTEFGLVMYARKLQHLPQIDGVLEEPAWQQITPLTEFYQCIWKLRAYPIEGKAEVYVGYSGNSLYVGAKGYEPSTESLIAEITQRDDERLSRDDCIEIFMDTNRDYQTYYHIILNSLGTIMDKYKDEDGNWDFGWSGPSNVATKVEDTFWTIEIEIPADQLHQGRIQSGDIWGFNVARVRIANASEYGQWTPTYGNAHRPDRFGFLVID